MPQKETWFDELLTEASDRQDVHHTPVSVNGRFRVHSVTGLQRYAEELISRMKHRLELIEPARKLTGAAGHAWEQVVLPARTRGTLLWSPCNTGPIAVRRQVVTIHDTFPLDHPEWFTKGFVRCYRAIVPPLIRNAQHLIAVSDYTKRRIAAAVPEAEGKTTVIHSGIGPQFNRKSIFSAGSSARLLGLPSRNYMLSVSSLEPRKNLKRILCAWERALPELPPDLWLVLAGKQGSSTVFGSEDLGSIPSRVVFTGYVPDSALPGLYAGAQAFLFPSLAEGFGFPPLEAMACGVPVLTSNCTSLIEVCGSATYLVDPLDTDQVAQAIRDLATDGALRVDLRHRGLTRVRAFQWDRAAEKTWDVMERALCMRPRRAIV